MTHTLELERVWILQAHRLGCSVNGNPRWEVTFTDGVDGDWTYLTSSDSACSYEVENFRNSKALVDVWLTRAGRVSRLVAS